MTRVFNKKKMFKMIDECDLISFDIFDTLIKRNCLEPYDIFEIVQRRFNLHSKTKIKNFPEDRKKAEQKAREASEYEDVNLVEIYKSFENYDAKTLKKLMKIEIETELLFCTRNNQMYEIYQYCKHNNKKIICISDMYLSEKDIRKILEKNCYNIEEIYVSSEIRKLKRTGNLFKQVFQNYNIKKSKILHIGDSKRSDFLIPKMLGIKTYLIPTYVNNCNYIKLKNLKDLNTRILYSFINNNVSNFEDKYIRIGYEILGPIIYSFCRWIHNLALKEEASGLYFCARDMHFVQKAYNKIYDKDAILNKYLYISRKSIKLPFLYKNNEFEDFCSVITDKKMKLYDILDNNGIKIKNLDKVLEKYSLSPSHEYNHDELIDSKSFREFYESVIRKKLSEVSEVQYSHFINYLKSLHFDEKSVIVDLGWKGTIQYSLMKILNNKNLKGFYFGLERRAYAELNKDNSFGFLFDQFSSNGYEDKIYSFRSLFEIFFLALHGSTLSYSSEEEGYYILGKSENENDTIIDRIQFGAMEFIDNFKNYYDYVDEVNIEEIICDLIRIGTNPTLEETKVFGDMNFDNMICGKLAQPKKIKEYILNPKKLKIELFKSEWKVGFLKRLLVIKLPYYKIYNFLRKLKRN